MTKGQLTYSASGVVPTNVVELSVADQKMYDSGSLDLASDRQFLEAVKALGVNDIIMPGASSDTDSDKKSSDTDKDKKSSDSDKPTRISSGSSDTDTDSEEDTEVLDPHWDDDEYWNSTPANDDGGDDNGYDDGYYDEDDGYYDEDYYEED